ncbi:hypothetical protein CLOP_g20965 [Closterium sp. NIES-67]|nr:hypothetical protein CLOP_g20965 [Closterium sp. NIES-67]
MGGESMVQGSGGLEGPGQGSVGEMQQMQQQGGFGQGQAQGSMAGGAMGDGGLIKQLAFCDVVWIVMTRARVA